MEVIERFNKVVDLARDLGDPSLKQALIDVRAELKKLLTENQRLKEEVRTLRESLDNRARAASRENRVKFERGAYWLMEENGVLRGPMCRRCWESKQALERLGQQTPFFYTCSKCGAVARLPGVRPA